MGTLSVAGSVNREPEQETRTEWEGEVRVFIPWFLPQEADLGWQGPFSEDQCSPQGVCSTELAL